MKTRVFRYKKKNLEGERGGIHQLKTNTVQRQKKKKRSLGRWRKKGRKRGSRPLLLGGGTGGKNRARKNKMVISKKGSNLFAGMGGTSGDKLGGGNFRCWAVKNANTKAEEKNSTVEENHETRV